jgi:LuxR family maltose regulon positive regulatory protein
MSTPLLTTKLFIPPLQAQVVQRPRLTAQLNHAALRNLTLISAPAGFGKTTLLSEWLAAQTQRVAWLSLDPSDNDPQRFLSYVVAALQTVAPNVGIGVQGALQMPQPPSHEVLLTTLLNDLAAQAEQIILVLDDYHLIDSPQIDQALSFLLTHLPPQLRLVIATREDPQLPLARLRARGQLTELRVDDLRFSYAEADTFLSQSMGVQLADDLLHALTQRTEGWITGLQLAALSMQGHSDTDAFIASFSGSHHFILDYLVEEVLHQQSEEMQRFLLHTAMLDRLCGPLCDAVLGESEGYSQTTLVAIERANLFIVPLDQQRRWYRYHHLFAELLRQRLQQMIGAQGLAELHRRASAWYEAHEFDVEAFQHATQANDPALAARLLEGNGMPLLFRGAVAPIVQWLRSLAPAVLDSIPNLWITYASSQLFTGQLGNVEPLLQAAERALQRFPSDDPHIRDHLGHVASIRATLAITQHRADEIAFQARKALELLHPANVPVRTATTWMLGHAYLLRGERQTANQLYREALEKAQAIGHHIIVLSSTLGLGNLEAADLHFDMAIQRYHQALAQAGDPPPPIICEAHLGLARIFYERNDLATAQQHTLHAHQLAQQLEHSDRIVASMLWQARLYCAQGHYTQAAARLAQAQRLVQQYHFALQQPALAAEQIHVLLQQGRVAEARQYAPHAPPLSQARLLIAEGDGAAALTLLGEVEQQAEECGWPDVRLHSLRLQALAWQVQDDKRRVMQVLSTALALAAPHNHVRSWLDEGPAMALLLASAITQGIQPEYSKMLLAHFQQQQQASQPAQPLIEPLTQRELHILQLIAQGRSNREISEQLFLALSTIKGHVRIIFDKLQVQRRTEAVARARELDLL